MTDCEKVELALRRALTNPHIMKEVNGVFVSDPLFDLLNELTHINNEARKRLTNPSSKE